MAQLGVSQKFSDEKNMEIIKEKYAQNKEQTKKQVDFLVFIWKGDQRNRARKYKAYLRELELKEG